MAGDPWPARLENQGTEAIPKQVTKVYRGQVTLVDAASLKKDKSKPRQVYRGQIVN